MVLAFTSRLLYNNHYSNSRTTQPTNFMRKKRDFVDFSYVYKSFVWIGMQIVTNLQYLQCTLQSSCLLTAPFPRVFECWHTDNNVCSKAYPIVKYQQRTDQMRTPRMPEHWTPEALLMGLILCSGDLLPSLSRNKQLLFPQTGPHALIGLMESYLLKVFLNTSHSTFCLSIHFLLIFA